MAEMQESLLPGLDDDENAVDAFVGCLTNSQVKVVGLELVFCRLYDHIGLNAIPSDMFRHMMVCRLYNPGSKLRTADYLERYLHVSYSVSKIYQFLDNLCYREEPPKGKSNAADSANENGEARKGRRSKSDYKSLVEQISYNLMKNVVGGSISVCFYDMICAGCFTGGSRRGGL